MHPDFEAVGRTLARQLAVSAANGAAVCVYHRGECVVDVFGGSATEAGDPWRSDTVVLSFSTTKGVVATLLHVLVDRGMLDFDDPVSRYWPEFGAAGKHTISVRQLLSHEAGLYDARRHVPEALDMLDWSRMVAHLEAATPAHAPGERHGYHGLTWGWLVGELIQRVAGAPLPQLIQSELATPLGLDGLFLGLPPEERSRRAHLLTGRLHDITVADLDRHQAREGAIDLAPLRDAFLPCGIENIDWNSDAVADACMPSANGFFTARSLARLYATLGAGGELDGVRLLSRDTLYRATAVQNRGIGCVVPYALDWRLGYHQVPVAKKEGPAPYGHLGLGGSGAWSDPARELAIAFVTNRGVVTPFGDTRLIRVGLAAARSADRRAARGAA